MTKPWEAPISGQSAPVDSARTLTLADEGATQRLAQALAPLLGVGDVVTLTGDLGVGKTALARALIRELTGDPLEEVPSPTFTLVQCYETGAGTVWHFDLYRLSAPDEVFELGWEEATLNGILLVEWPERLGALLPSARLDLSLAFDPGGPDARRVTLSGPGWLARLAPLRLGDSP